MYFTTTNLRNLNFRSLLNVKIMWLKQQLSQYFLPFTTGKECLFYGYVENLAACPRTVERIDRKINTVNLNNIQK